MYNWWSVLVVIVQTMEICAQMCSVHFCLQYVRVSHFNAIRAFVRDHSWTRTDPTVKDRLAGEIPSAVVLDREALEDLVEVEDMVHEDPVAWIPFAVLITVCFEALNFLVTKS